MSALASRVEAAIARVEALPDVDAREAARAAVSAVLDLHREGLARLAQELPFDVRRDPLVASLFAIHDVELGSKDPSLVPAERLLSRRTDETRTAHERCDLCGSTVPFDHEHLYEVASNSLRCTCPACAVLFDAPGSKMRRVRRLVRRLDDLCITDTDWAALEVPVALAFFRRSSSTDDVIAAYPGPAGATQAVVPREAWGRLARANPLLAELDADITALLVDRRAAPARYYVASIDECYRLAGLVRTRWRGISGGHEASVAVDEFFSAIDEERA